MTTQTWMRVAATVFTATLALAGPVVADETSRQTDAARTALETTIDAAIAAWEAADAEAAWAFYGEDATILTAQGLVPTEEIPAALRYHFQLLVKQTFAFEERGVRFLSPGHAMSWVVGTTSGENAEGDVIFGGSIQVSITWRLVGEVWRIAFMHEGFYPST